MVVDLQLPVQSVPTTTIVESLNLAHGEVYLIHYVIKFFSDLRQAGSFLRFSPPINKTDSHNITVILLKMALKHHNAKPKLSYLHSTTDPCKQDH